MKVLTSTGFFNTGSSVITDIFSEFDEVSSAGGVNEIRLLYEADCISDLEFNLIENPHRHNTSNAIKKFRKFVDFSSNPLFDHHYENIFHNNFKVLSYRYINDISDFVYKGQYHGDFYNKGKLFWFINRCYQKILRIFFSKRIRPSFISNSLLSKNELSYAGTFDKTKFLSATKEYIGSLLNEYSKGKGEYVLIDQFLPSSNITRYLKYLPDDVDAKIFIIDRDPIDLYFSDKFFSKSSVIPSYDVNKFCDWYLWTREQSKLFSQPKNVMRLRFEDFIYDYEETRRKVCHFAGINLNSKCNQFKFFDPKKSVNNTQMIKRFKNVDMKDVEIIRNRLSEYCYNFPETGEIQPDFTKQNMFDR